jgi:hypothetical protein
VKPALWGASLLAAAVMLSGCGKVDAFGPMGPKVVSSVTVKDPRDDLWSGDPRATRDAHRSQEVANGDALGAVVRRTSDALVVTVRYVDIERHASPDWGIEFEFDIGDYSTREVTWSEYRFSDTHRWDRDLDMVRYDSEDSLSASCGRLRARPDFSAETLTIRVPDGCFRHARLLMVHGLVAHARPPGRHTKLAYDHLGTSGRESVDTPVLVPPDKSRKRT